MTNSKNSGGKLQKVSKVITLLYLDNFQEMRLNYPLKMKTDLLKLKALILRFLTQKQK